MRASSRAIVWELRRTSSAPAFSCKWSSRVVPGIGMMWSPRASSQARASCAMVQSFARDRRQVVEQCQIAGEILALKTRLREADILRGQRADIAHRTGKKAAPER